MTTRTLIQAEELAARLDDPRLRIFDCRFDLARPDVGRERVRDGHLPGAVYADLNRDLSAPDHRRRPADIRCPRPATFAARLRAWGVNADSQRRRLRRRQRHVRRAAVVDAALARARRRSRCSTAACAAGCSSACRSTHAVPTPRPATSSRARGPAMAVDAAAVVAGSAATRRRAPRRARARSATAARSNRSTRVAGHVPGRRATTRSRRSLDARRPLPAAGGAARGAVAQPRTARRAGAADRDVRLGRHGLPPAARARARGPRRRATLPGLLERVVERPGAPGRTRRGALSAPRARRRDILAAASAIVRASFYRLARSRSSGQRPHASPPRAAPGRSRTPLDLYGVDAWGNGYFGINAAGHVVVRPDQTAEHEIDLLEVIRGPRGARPDDARRRALLRHPAPPPEAAARRVRAPRSPRTTTATATPPCSRSR